MKHDQPVVQKLLVTEKGTRLNSEGKYQFQVHPDANKVEIKRAVEQQFNVHVTKVNTMNRLGKIKRGRTVAAGRASNWKRAVVTLKTGETINLA